MKILSVDLLIKRVDDQDIEESEAVQFSEELLNFLEEFGFEMQGMVALTHGQFADDDEFDFDTGEDDDGGGSLQ